jgi:hypothetical protein
MRTSGAVSLRPNQNAMMIITATVTPMDQTT